jgi:hypothetical protein
MVLLLGLAGGLAFLAFYGAGWKLLIPALPAAAVLHWMIWNEEIRADWRHNQYLSPLLHMGRDVLGVAAAWFVGHLIFLFFVGAINF